MRMWRKGVAGQTICAGQIMGRVAGSGTYFVVPPHPELSYLVDRYVASRDARKGEPVYAAETTWTQYCSLEAL